MTDERLEELSDLVRRGISISFGEALQVIEYQGVLKKLRESNSIKRRTKNYGKKLMGFFSK